MKRYFIILLTFLSGIANAQQDSAATATPAVRYQSFERNTTLITLSVGIADWHRQNYKFGDTMYAHGSASGFSPVYLKIERAVSSHVSIAANFMYDGFYYNYTAPFYTNGLTATRYYRDNVSAFSGGLIGYYHFGKLIPVNNLDVFVGIGGTFDRINHTGYPDTDSIRSKTDYTVSPYIKAGARYYINRQVSLFADVGYDRISIASVGLSCRLY